MTYCKLFYGLEHFNEMRQKVFFVQKSFKVYQYKLMDIDENYHCRLNDGISPIE